MVQRTNSRCSFQAHENIHAHSILNQLKMEAIQFTWGTNGVGYKVGTGPFALIGYHGLNGKWNDAASAGSDVMNGALDLTKFTCFFQQLPAGVTDWGKNIISAGFNVVQKCGFTSARLCGDSLGGMAVFRAMAYNDDPTITNWPKLDIISAGIVCGKDDRHRYASYAKTKIKMWHGTADPIMSYSAIVNAASYIKLVGGDAQLVSLQGVGHNAWDYGFNPQYPGNFFEWLNQITQ